MDREQFMALCHIINKRNTEWRWGQVVYNVALNHFPEKALNASGTDIDPFYINERIRDFLDYLFGDQNDDTRVRNQS